MKYQQIPQQFLCPISRMPMNDPVLASDQECYNRQSIQAWFKNGNTISPKNNQFFQDKMLYPIKNLKSLIKAYQQHEIQNKIQMLAQKHSVLIKIENEKDIKISNQLMQIQKLNFQISQLKRQNQQLKHLIVIANSQIQQLKDKSVNKHQLNQYFTTANKDFQKDLSKRIIQQIEQGIQQFTKKIKNKVSAPVQRPQKPKTDGARKKLAVKQKLKQKILNSLEEKDKQLKKKLTRLQEIEVRIKQQFERKKINGNLIKNKNYEGEFLKGKKHGIGRLIKNKQIYFGQFMNDYPQGFGILQRSKLDSFKGYFRLGIRQQFGIGLWQSGRKYTGQWKNDRMSGYGWQQNTEKVKIYRGNFVQQLYQGQGDIKYHDGFQFTGIFQNDAPKDDRLY